MGRNEARLQRLIPVARRVRALIGGLVVFSEARKLSQSDLKTCFSAINGGAGCRFNMRPATIAAWARLFAIPEGNVDSYIGSYAKFGPHWQQCEIKTPPVRPIGRENLDAIRRTLEHLKIYRTAPPVPDDKPKYAERFLDHALREVAQRIAATAAAPAVSDQSELSFGIAQELRVRMSGLLDYYGGDWLRRVPFGGRDDDLALLDAWLDDKIAAPRKLVTSLAGRGKTALLIEWVRRLQSRRDAEQWQIAFMPVSLRARTHQPGVAFRGLASRLKEIIAGSEAKNIGDGEDAAKDAIRAYVQQAAATGERVLIIVDGLDELPYGDFDAAFLFPMELPETIRIVLSARWQAGDVGPDGWLQRLGWDTGCAVAPPLVVEKLSEANLRTLLRTHSRYLKKLADHPAFFAELARVVQGEPILARLYIEALSLPKASHDHLAPENLPNISPGLQGFFERWLFQHDELRRSEGMVGDDDRWDATLSILAFARAGLNGRMLLELMSVAYGYHALPSERILLRSLRRLVIGNGKDGNGYILAHPSIADFLREKRYKGSVLKIERGFAAWGLQHARAVGDAKNADIRSYLLQFLRDHATSACLSHNEWSELTRNPWRLASIDFDGSSRSFAADVRQALCSQAEALDALGFRWRCALLLASIHQVSHSIPANLIYHAARRDLISMSRALGLAENIRPLKDSVRLLVRLAHLRPQGSVDCSEFMQAALRAAHSANDEIESLSMLAEINHDLPPDLQRRDLGDQLLMLIEGQYEWYIDARLLILPRYLDKAGVDRALAAIERMQEPRHRGLSLLSLVHRSTHADIPRVVKTMEGVPIESEIYILVALLDRMEEPAREQALRKAERFFSFFLDIDGTEKGRTKFIVDLTRLTKLRNETTREAVVSRIIEAVRTTDGEFQRAELIDLLAPELNKEWRAALVGIAEAIADPESRVIAMAALVDELSQEQLAATLRDSRRVRFPEWRLDMQLSLSKRLGEKVHRQCIDLWHGDALSLDDLKLKQNIYSALAPVLNDGQMKAVLETMSRVSDEQTCREICVGITNHASELSAGLTKSRLATFLPQPVEPEVVEPPKRRSMNPRWHSDGQDDVIKPPPDRAFGDAPALDEGSLAGLIAGMIRSENRLGAPTHLAQLFEALSGEQREVQMDNLLADERLLADEGQYCRVVKKLTSFLTEAQRDKVLATALGMNGAAGSEYEVADLGGSLVPFLTIENAPAATKLAYSFRDADRMILFVRRIASLLSEKDIVDALAAATRRGMTEEAIEEVFALVFHVTSERPLCEVASSVLVLAPRWPRKSALELAWLMLVVVEKLGGADAVREVQVAVQDCFDWYP